MKITIEIETEERCPLTHYGGKIRVANGNQRKEFLFDYFNPFPSIDKDDKLPLNSFQLSEELSPRLVLLLKDEVYLNITDNKRDGSNKIVSKEEVKKSFGNDLLGWSLS